jgi:hypothetical protein
MGTYPLVSHTTVKTAAMGLAMCAGKKLEANRLKTLLHHVSVLGDASSQERETQYRGGRKLMTING